MAYNKKLDILQKVEKDLQELEKAFPKFNLSSCCLANIQEMKQQFIDETKETLLIKSRTKTAYRYSYAWYRLPINQNDAPTTMLCMQKEDKTFNFKIDCINHAIDYKNFSGQKGYFSLLYITAQRKRAAEKKEKWFKVGLVQPQSLYNRIEIATFGYVDQEPYKTVDLITAIYKHYEYETQNPPMSACGDVSAKLAVVQFKHGDLTS